MTIAQQIGRINHQIEVTAKMREFISLACIVALSKGEHGAAKAMADESSLIVKGIVKNQRFHDIVHRTAVAAGTTVDGSFAAPLADYQTLAGAFLESLRNYGVFDRMLPFMRRVPFRVRVGASTSGATGTTVGQGMVKPISNLALVGSTVTEQKAVCILTITEELARFGDNDLFAIELANAVAVETDESFISILTAGVTASPSFGATAEHAWWDIRTLLSAITTNARSQLFLMTTPAIAKTLSTMHGNNGTQAFPGVNFNGGSLSGINVAVSDGVPSGTLILADAQQIAAASDTLVLDESTQGSVQLDSAPDSPQSASTNLVSLWQTNHVGLKATRWFAATKLTSSGVAVVTGASYSGDSPGP